MYNIEVLAESYGNLKRPENSEIFQYPVVPSGTVCPRCKDWIPHEDNKVLYGKLSVDMPADQWASDRVCDDCKNLIDLEDFGEVIPDSEFEEFPEHDGERLFLKDGRVFRLE